MPLAVDRKPFDPEGGPLQSCNFRGKRAAECDSEKLALLLERDTLDRHRKEAGFVDADEPATAGADLDSHVAGQIKPNFDVHRCVEERKRDAAGERGADEAVLLKEDLEGSRSEREAGEGPRGRRTVEPDAPRDATRPDVEVLESNARDRHRLGDRGRQVNLEGTEHDALPGWRQAEHGRLR